MIRFPEKLSEGDKVCFIAPARKVSKNELNSAITLLTHWGLEVVETPGLYDESNQFAGDDLTRTRQVQWALDNEDVKAIFCVRGGYGTSRIIDKLCFDNFLKSPKWLVGFSDITILLNRLYNLQIASIHGPVALLFNQAGNDKAMNDLRSLLFNEVNNGLEAPVNSLNQLGEAKGDLVGGNLSVLVDQIGTDSFPELDGRLLFIEDLDEYLYHIDRLIVHLRRINAFKKVKGIVVGYMSNMHDNQIPFGKTAYEIIKDAVSDLEMPVAFGFPIGHQPDNRPVIVGRNYTLKVAAQGVLLTNN